MVKKKHIYKVMFYHIDEVYELYARSISESDMFGFLEVEEMIFKDPSSILLDPSEEKLKAEFDGVQCVLVPMSSIIRVDVVKTEGVAKANPLTAKQVGNVKPFPSVMAKPPKQET